MATAVDATISDINESPEKLEAFLLDQNFRLASWRVAGDEINYRRFFDLNELAAVRMEDPQRLRRCATLRSSSSSPRGG